MIEQVYIYLYKDVTYKEIVELLMKYGIIGRDNKILLNNEEN